MNDHVEASGRVLVLGASGRLGGAIAASLLRRLRGHVATPSREELALDLAAPFEAAARWIAVPVGGEPVKVT